MDMKRLTSMMVLMAVTACGGVSSGDDPDGTGGPVPTGGSLVPAGVERSSVRDDADIETLVAGLNDAGFALWSTLPIEEEVVLSPLSIGHALLMARAAADDGTGAAIDLALRLAPAQEPHIAWNALDAAISTSADREPEIVVSIADRIWPRLDVDPDQSWVDLLAAQHGVTVEKLDFAGDGAGSRQAINDWVSDQTRGLIPDLLPEGFIRPDTVLVLTDAVYFEADWQTWFGKYGTVDGTFTLLDGSERPAQFMRELELSDRRGVGDGFVGAEIPYVGGEFSMLVLVPDAGRFEEIRDRLDQSLLNEIDGAFTTGPFELLLPKWMSNSALDLIDWLSRVGAAPGSYPGISEDAFLDAAVHGADISVDEWGTVAAAATGFGFAESGPPEPELTVSADRPFLYLIRHRPTGAVLFAGQVMDPTS